MSRRGGVLIVVALLWSATWPMSSPSFEGSDGLASADAKPATYGSVRMSTGKLCYRPGELVRVTASGTSYVPHIGDFPRIFWSVTNVTGGSIWQTFNPLTAVGSIDGTLEGIWNQTYRYGNDRPPSGEPVPPGTYTVWFYEIPVAPWYPDTWIPTNVTIGDCSGTFTVDAGGPYVGTEGDPITLKAAVSGAAGNVSVRWDFQDDGVWDSSWSPDFTALHAYGDDFQGRARVEARGSVNTSPVDVDHMKPAYFFTATNHQVSMAQSFVPTAPTLAAVDLDVAIHWGTPEDAYYVTIRENLDGPNLTQARVPSDALPGPPPPPCGYEVLFDFPDIAVTPGQTYYIVMTSPGTFGETSDGGNYQACGTLTDYPNGTYWGNDTGQWEDQSVYGYPDLRFRTYASGGTETVNATASVDVSNVAPVIMTTAASNGDEGDTITFSAHVADPGSDDLSLAWSGNCVGWSAPATYWNDPAYQPDPDPSPNVNPRDVTDTQTVVCGDNGAYDWNVKVEDDDGGVTTASGTFSVDNLPPTLTVSPPSQLTVDEGTLVALDATVEDPGSDDLTFTWSWQHGPTETRTYYNDGVGPDPTNSPDGTFPFTASDSSSHTYGDDCECLVRLTVEDDDGGSVTYETTVWIVNVAPIAALDDVDLTLNDPRTVGYWGHQCTVDEADPYGEHTGILQPWIDRIAAESRAFVGITSKAEVCAIVDEGDAANMTVMARRQIMGAWLNLVSGKLDPRTAVDMPDLTTAATVAEAIREAENLLIASPDRTELERAKDIADAINNGRGVAVAVAEFTANATDAGSDDLTFSWDFGDGRTEGRTYFSDGLGPDPFPSPDVNPMAAADSTIHSYWGLGTYTVTLTVTDDDGGTTAVSFILVVG